MQVAYQHNQLFSPSQLKVADTCLAQWIWRYLHGRKPASKPWQVFGKMAHAHLENWTNTGNVLAADYGQEILDGLSQLPEAKAAQFKVEAPKRALMATQLIPDPRQHPSVAETQFDLDTTLFFQGPRVTWSPQSAIDLVIKFGDRWVVIDYKTTRGRQIPASDSPTGKGYFDQWYYVPTEQKLLQDPQLLLYGLAVMVATGAREVTCRWLYIASEMDRKPQVKPVDVTLTLEAAVQGAAKWVALAQYLSQWVGQALRLGPPPESVIRLHLPTVRYPDKQSACEQYGGCTQHVTKGGRCNAGMNATELMGLTL